MCYPVHISRLFFALLSLLPFCSIGQDVKQGLIVVHVDPMSKGEFKQKIYNYHFLNGHYTGRDEVIIVSGKKDGKDYIRTDIGNSTLYKDRYLITGIGNIIDLKEKKILFDGRANLVRCSNDSAIYYTNDAFKGKFYSVYNFKTNTYGEVKNLVFKAKAGQDVEFDKTASPFKLNLYPPNKPKIELVKDAGYGQSGTGSTTPDPAMWWIDNSNFVYANFNKENTEVTFYKVNVDSKSSTAIGKVAIKPETQAATIEKLNNKQTVMTLGAKQILIDLGANTVSDLVFTVPANGFSYECKTQGYGHAVKLNDKEVGKYHFRTKNFKTENNIAALVKEIVMGEESYQQGLGVWNNNKPGWEKVDAEDVLVLIGFIKE
ncbi:MAG: hypothetical protein K0S32_3317 [Bacteroidetes bacterium]|jgi:hypothetical protein|nr:hypothetical protein [Bacteroidota bacterium]